jgi:hypothetical protein
MGRVIIKFKDNHLERFKCKSKERAQEIFDKRPNAIEWNFYEDYQYVPQTRKQKKVYRDPTLEELEMMMRGQGLM